MIASIEKTGEKYVARFERNLDHSAKEVWAWLTENEKLSQWFPELRVGELREGGYMTFNMPDGSVEKLQITDFVNRSLLEFSWWEDNVRFELNPRANGCTLTLMETINMITDHTPKDLAGWHVCLDMIGALLDGKSIDRMTEWKKWYEEYVQAIGK